MAIVKPCAEDSEDCFPVGMRVLAVDDNPPCLLLLATLLRRCKYRVTTTNQAMSALRMLRERKDDFDLVISDVDMPDMDGFKLLEYVGLEMDLPVIMLSSHSDPKLVMRGIRHGACDYLLKPVRIEELQNIWQHVIRRKSDGKEQKSGEKGYNENDDGASESRSKRRKEQKDEEEDEGYENDRGDNDDSNAQKKPRVVWSVELHGKFVAAVNQLGLDKAVPKKILDLMNVDKLTRENVASHLQKYRLYLKRIKSVANQQALVDPTSIHSTSMNGFGCHFPIRTLANRGMLRRLNSSPGFSLRDLPSLPQFNSLEAPEYNNYYQNNVLQGLPVSDGGRRDDSTMFGSSSGYQGDKTVAIDGDSAALRPSYPMVESWCGVARDDILGVNLRKDNVGRTLQPIGGFVRNPNNVDYPVQFDSSVPEVDGRSQMLVAGNYLDDLSYSVLDGPGGLKDGFLEAQHCLHSSYASNCFGSLEDLVGSVVKQEQGWGI